MPLEELLKLYGTNAPSVNIPQEDTEVWFHFPRRRGFF